MKRNILPWFGAALLALASCGFLTGANPSAPYTAFSGTLTSTGTTVALPLSAGGYSTCSVVVSGNAVGAVATAQVASDSPGNAANATFVTATTVGASGAVGPNGTYVGNVASTGLAWFQVQLSAISSGSWNYTESCSQAVGTSGGGGGGGNVTVSNTPGVVCISGCSGGAAPTPMPTASAGAPPTAAPPVIAEGVCFVPAGATPNATGGNLVADACNANGARITVFPSAQPITLASALPAGAAVIGAVTQSGGPWTVSQATASNLNANVSQATASNLNATVVQGTAASLNATVVFPSAQPITVATALPAGANVIGGVTQSGTWTVTPTLPYSAASSGQTATANSVLGVGGVYNSAAPTLTNGQFAPSQLDVNGNAKVNCVTGCSGSGGGSLSAIYNGTATPTPFPTPTSAPLQLDANANLKVTGSGVAGSPAPGVFSVQGIAGGTNLNINCNNGCQLPFQGGSTGNATGSSQMLSIGAVNGSGTIDSIKSAAQSLNINPTDSGGTNITSTTAHTLLSSICANTATANCASITTAGSLFVNQIGRASHTTLTSASATSCTSLQTGTTGTLVAVVNANASAQTQTISFFDEGSSPTCASADQVYQVTLGGGQMIVLNLPLGAGLAYTLSGAIANNIIVYRAN